MTPSKAIAGLEHETRVLQPEDMEVLAGVSGRRDHDESQYRVQIRAA